ncbi:MAG: hypothetical protein ACI915_005437 [Gammaproteobacteria bacterium]|jgi:hypothetical protein
MGYPNVERPSGERLRSTIECLEAFYNRMAPRAERALAYLQTVALDDISEPNANSLRLLLTLAEVSAGY